MAITILEGSTFCISDDLGDVGQSETSGFFDKDVRFLSRLQLTINGERGLLLAAKRVEYFSAAFYLRNPLARGLEQDVLLIARERFVSAGMLEQIVIRNESPRSCEFELGLELAADFADIFTVKDRDLALGSPLLAAPLPPPATPELAGGHDHLIFRDASGGLMNDYTQVVLSLPPSERRSGTLLYDVALEPRSEWRLTLDVHPSSVATADRPSAPESVRHRFGQELAHVRRSLEAWHLRIPQLRASQETLQKTFEQSVSDIAALRLRSDDRFGELPAAGMPWFMTVFGRDTIIASLQTLLFGPELARTALSVLAELQAQDDDASIDAEPGKIVHELRHGKAADRWFATYYGTVDATPLYLVLLSEVWRWTDDAVLVRELQQPALRALEWIDRHGDRNGDGFVEYERRTPRGLENQSWKDSGGSQRFSDGRPARPPIAPCEVQGYVYDAKRRCAELAREVWRDRELAERLDREAHELARRFNERFWIEERGGYYALALDGDGLLVDALSSNIGHLLWSGIVPHDRVDAVVDQLMAKPLWSGWGVRTMSTDDGAYNPLAYHNGSVWPHDNSLLAWGLARYGRWPELQRVARRMFEAAANFGYQVPEVFAGLPRSDTAFPVPYPTPGKPQAWAAGTPILLIQLLLGLHPDPRRHTLTTMAPTELPSWIGTLRLDGVRAFDTRWDVRLEDGTVRVDAVR